MPSLKTKFFADDSDILELISSFEFFGDFKYIEPLSKLNRTLNEYLDLSDVKNDFCESEMVGGMRSSFLVVDASTQIVKRKIMMSDGSGFKEKMDQFSNPDSSRRSEVK